MMNYKILARDIQKKLKNSLKHEESHKIIYEEIKKHIIKNSELLGLYSGSILGNPDPLSGIYKWNVISLNIDAKKINKPKNFKSWAIKLLLLISNNIIYSASDSNTLITYTGIVKPHIIFPLPIKLQTKLDFNSNIELISKIIIGGLQSSIPTPLNLPSISNGGGIGNTVFQKIN